METECSLPCSQEPATFPYLILNNPVYALPFCFFKINYNIFLCMPVASKRCLSFRYPCQSSLCISLFRCTCLVPSPSHPLWFDDPNNIWCGEQTTKLCMTSDFRREVGENCVLITQRVVVIPYRRIGSIFVDGTDRLSRNVDKELPVLAA